MLYSGGLVIVWAGNLISMSQGQSVDEVLESLSRVTATVATLAGLLLLLGGCVVWLALLAGLIVRFIRRVRGWWATRTILENRGRRRARRSAANAEMGAPVSK